MKMKMEGQCKQKEERKGFWEGGGGGGGRRSRRRKKKIIDTVDGWMFGGQK